MIDLYFVYNGHRKFYLGTFEHIHSAIKALKEHQYVNSAITKPHFSKSMVNDVIRIDYGARDCYYLIVASERQEGML